METVVQNETIKYGVVTPEGVMKELFYYEIKELFERIMKLAIEDNEEYRKIYEEKYEGKYTCFSDAIEFCLHELGWMIYDPYSVGADKVMFSNGNMSYVADRKVVLAEGFDRKSVTATTGMPRLTDENVSYDKTLMNFDSYEEGIVTEDGYVSSHVFNDKLNILSRVMLMHEMTGSETLYKHYMENRPSYATTLEYYTSFPNVISVKKQGDSFSLQYVSENDGKVQEFIDTLNITGKLSNYDPVAVEEDRAYKLAA